MVLVDAENVRRSKWPNLARDDLEKRVARWAEANDVDAEVVWEGATTADDEIARRVAADDDPAALVVVTSDRNLAERVREHGAEVQTAGGFRRRLDAL